MKGGLRKNKKQIYYRSERVCIYYKMNADHNW
jgi:hypothetical protein